MEEVSKICFRLISKVRWQTHVWVNGMANSLLIHIYLQLSCCWRRGSLTVGWLLTADTNQVRSNVPATSSHWRNTDAFLLYFLQDNMSVMKQGRYWYPVPALFCLPPKVLLQHRISLTSPHPSKWILSGTAQLVFNFKGALAKGPDQNTSWHDWIEIQPSDQQNIWNNRSRYF